MLTSVRLEETAGGLQVEIAGMGGHVDAALPAGLRRRGAGWPAARLDRYRPRRAGNAEPAAEGRGLPAAPRRDQAEPVGHPDRRPAQARAGRDRGGCGQRQAWPPTSPRSSRMAASISVSRRCRSTWARRRSRAVGKLTVTVARRPGTARRSWSRPGFDELTAQARTNPDLQQALPVLIMLRGLAKPDGERLVWDIVSDGPTVTVNGIDLSQLGGRQAEGQAAKRSPVSRRAGRASPPARCDPPAPGWSARGSGRRRRDPRRGR